MTPDLPHEPSLEALVERVDAAERLTDAKFVTYRTLIDSQADKVALALSASEKAITKAETATERRFEAVNEFRQTLSDQAANFATKSTVDAQFTAMREKIDDLGAQVSRLLISLLISMVGVLIGALILVATRK
jgi:hypothetical protein